MYGKRRLGASHIPHLDVNVALPVANILVNRQWCSALIESVYSWSIISAEQCWSWTSKHVDMQTISGRMQACCSVGTLNICTNSGNSAKVEILVVCDKPLGFDLFAEIACNV